MAVTQWQGGPTMRMPTVNPNGALQAATSSLANLGRMLESERNAELAERQQAWVEGEPERLLQEQERQKSLANQKARSILKAESASGGSLSSDFFAADDVHNLVTNAGWGEQEISNFVNRNKGLFTDPTVAYNSMYQNLVENHNFNAADAAAAASSYVSRLKPTADPALMEKLLVTPNTSLGVNVGKGGTGGVKGKSGSAPKSNIDHRTDFIKTFGVPAGTRRSWGDIVTDQVGLGNYSLNEATLDKVVGTLMLGPNAGSEAGTYNALKGYMDNGNDIKFDPRAMTPDLIRQIQAEARAYDANPVNSSSGGFQPNPFDFEAQAAWNSDVLSRMTPQVATREQMMSALMSALGTQQTPPVDSGSGTTSTANKSSQQKITDLVSQATPNQTEAPAQTLPDPVAETPSLVIPEGTFGDNAPTPQNLFLEALLRKGTTNSLSNMELVENLKGLLPDFRSEPSLMEEAQNRVMPQSTSNSKRPTKVGELVWTGFPPRPVRIINKKQLEEAQSNWDKQNR